jgi:hypothetical protein
LPSSALARGYVHRLRGLANLWRLDLGYTRVADEDLAHLAALTRLRVLKPGRCDEVTDAGLAHLGRLKDLESLDLRNCPRVTEGGLAALRQALPRCVIDCTPG